MDRKLMWIDSSLEENTEVVGGKAGGLARIAKSGGRIPEGFVVPAEAYGVTVRRNEIEAAVESMCKRHGSNTRFAVRSSAVHEDGASASFAGIFVTLLDVPGNGVISAIEACISAAMAPRVLSYAQAQTRPVILSLAVVIQRMLRVDVAGVCFSVNPVTSSAAEIVIEAVRGVGERLVSGNVTPECYRLNKSDGSLLDFEPGDETSDYGDQLLSDEELRSLWAGCNQLTNAFGCPLDIEFAFAEGYLYFLQARPITTVGM